MEAWQVYAICTSHIAVAGIGMVLTAVVTALSAFFLHCWWKGV